MLAEPPDRLIEAAAEVQQFCDTRRLPFCFIGGLAVVYWGEARVTRDADLTIFVGLEGEQAAMESLLERFAARISDAAGFARKNRVLLLKAANGTGVDVSLGLLEFERQAVNAATLEEFAPGLKLRLCPPGALVVYKVFAGRPQDWLDVEGIVVKSGKLIDWQVVRRDLKELLALKEDYESLERLEAILSKHLA